MPGPAQSAAQQAHTQQQQGGPEGGEHCETIDNSPTPATATSLTSLPQSCLEAVFRQLGNTEHSHLRATCRELRDAVDAVACPHVQLHLTPEVLHVGHTHNRPSAEATQDGPLQDSAGATASTAAAAAAAEPAKALRRNKGLWASIRLHSSQLLHHVWPSSATVGRENASSAGQGSPGQGTMQAEEAAAADELADICSYLGRSRGPVSVRLVLGPRKMCRAECIALHKAAKAAEAEAAAAAKNASGLDPQPDLFGGSARISSNRGGKADWLIPEDVAGVVQQLGAAAGGRLRKLSIMAIAERPINTACAAPPFTSDLLATICTAFPQLQELWVLGDRAHGTPEAWDAAVAALPPCLHTLSLQFYYRLPDEEFECNSRDLMQAVVHEAGRRGRLQPEVSSGSNSPQLPAASAAAAAAPPPVTPAPAASPLPSPIRSLSMAWKPSVKQKLDLSALAHAQGLQYLRLQGEVVVGIAEALTGIGASLEGFDIDGGLYSQQVPQIKKALPHLLGLRSLRMDYAKALAITPVLQALPQLQELTVDRSELEAQARADDYQGWRIRIEGSSEDGSEDGIRGAAGGGGSGGEGSGGAGAGVAGLQGPQLKWVWMDGVQDIMRPSRGRGWKTGLASLVQRSPMICSDTHLAMRAGYPWTLMREVPDLKELGDWPGGFSWWLPEWEGLGYTLIPANMVRPSSAGGGTASSSSSASATATGSITGKSSGANKGKGVWGRLLGQGDASAGVAASSAGPSGGAARPGPGQGPQLECEGVIVSSEQLWTEIRAQLTPATRVLLVCIWGDADGCVPLLQKLAQLVQAGGLPSLQRLVLWGLSNPMDGAWELPSKACQESLIRLAAAAWERQRAVLQVLAHSWLSWGYCQWLVRQLRGRMRDRRGRHGRAVPDCAVQLLSPVRWGEQELDARLGEYSHA